MLNCSFNGIGHLFVDQLMTTGYNACLLTCYGISNMCPTLSDIQKFEKEESVF